MPKHLALFLLLSTAPFTPAVGAEEKARDELIVQHEFARYGEFFGFGFGALWMMSGPKLVRIDSDDNAVRETLIEGAVGQVRRVAFSEDAVWLADAGSQRIYKIDPESGALLLDFYVDIYGYIEGTIAVGDGSVWIVTVNDRLLERFDLASGESQASITLPSAGAAVVFDHGAAWVTTPQSGELYRIDPGENDITDTIALLPLPRAMASGEGSIWVLNEPGIVQRIDPDTRRVVATIDTRLDGWGDISVGGGYVWFSVPGAFIQVDPRTNSISRMLNGLGTGLAQEDHSIRYGGDSLWVGGMPLRRVRTPG